MTKIAILGATGSLGMLGKKNEWAARAKDAAC
jgi:hypothetical protein